MTMYRLRFETIEQVFELPSDVQIVLPLDELAKRSSSGELPKILENHAIIVEIPAVLWEHSIESTKRKLEIIKSASVENVLCENIGAFSMCNDMGFKVHGGMFLNVINSSAIKQYKALRFDLSR